ncbi:MAG TPA: hypothetical protein VFA19_13475 [Gaiellaceae bacterium]|nr:hypothetical protein [Gaiellaceae bacterium]
MLRRTLPLLALLALVFGAGSAGGRTLANTTVVVEVFGQGQVTSSAPNTGIGCGAGATTCYLTFTSGGTVTLTQAAAAGWTFATWGGDCVVVSGACTIDASAGGTKIVDATFSATAGTTQSTLSVTYDAANGAGFVSAPEDAPPGSIVNCGSDGTASTTACSWTVLTGSTLTLFQTPQPGNSFSGWGGACSGGGRACTVHLGADAQVTATWVSSSATKGLTVAVGGNGTVTGGGISCPSTCTASEPLNAGVTLTATPASGYAFTGWTGDCTGTGSCTLTMSADRSVTATFAPSVTLSVTVSGTGNVSGGSGAINCGSGANVCSAPFAANASVTLVATPPTGGAFLGWTGACGGTATTCTVSMNASKSVTASFASAATLTVSATGPGTVSGGGITCGSQGGTCSAPQQANAIVTLTASPDSGASFAGWGGACSGTSPTCTLTMSAAKSVSASFSSGGGGGGSSPQLTVSVSGSGSVSGGGISCGNGGTTCTVTLQAGTRVTLTERPASGTSFSGWGGACSGTSSTCTVTVGSSTTAVSAAFATGKPGTLTLGVSGRGSVSTSGGACSSTGATKTCVQHLRANAKATIRATPARGARFLGWGGACASAKTATCTVTLDVVRSVSARFSGATSTKAVLASLGRPVVTRQGGDFQVTLRFRTKAAGVARVHGLRAGRIAATFSLRVAAGNATLRVPVAKTGSYVFELKLGTHALRWRTCLGICGDAVKSPRFVVSRESPTIVRAGDGWSLTLHLRSNLIAADQVRVERDTKPLVTLRFLGRAGQNSVPPFLLGTGNYTFVVTAIDAYGRARTLKWIVALR